MGELELWSMERLGKALVEEISLGRAAARAVSNASSRRGRLGEVVRAAATVVAGSLGRRRATRKLA